MPTTPKHRLRWYQYSLRSLFVLTVLVAIAGSWFAWKKQQVERQRAAVKAIEGLGGQVQYDYHFSGLPYEPPRPRGPNWMRAWLGDDFFADVVHVSLVHVDDAASIDAALEHVGYLPKVTSVWLGKNKVSYDGMERLKRLPGLQSLGLTSPSQLTDEETKKLKDALPNCHVFSFR